MRKLFRDLLMGVVWKEPRLGLWKAERYVYRACGGPAFRRSVANDITLVRGRISYVGINLLYVGYLAGLWSSEILLGYTLLSLVITVVGDGLDGFVAREMGPTRSGGFLDLCSDGAGALFPLIMVLHFLGWNLWFVVPVVGVVIAGFVVLAHRGKNDVPTHGIAKASQCGIYVTAAILFAGVMIQENVVGIASWGISYQALIDVGAWMLWATFGLKIVATAAYHVPPQRKKTPFF